jgi:hypothetical protein
VLRPRQLVSWLMSPPTWWTRWVAASVDKVIVRSQWTTVRYPISMGRILLVVG